MKHTRIPFLLCLFLALFMGTSCSDDDNVVPEPEDIRVTHSDLLGVYEVIDSQLETVNNGEFWDVRVKNINRGCTALQPYTFNSGELKFGENSFLIEKEDDFFLVTTPDQKTFKLIKTNSRCEDEVEIEYMELAEILGRYKVVDAYSYKSGEEPTQNAALLGQLWDIAEDGLNINCSLETLAFTFEKNTIVVGEVEYQVEKELAEEGFILTYLDEDVIYELHLSETTDVCPEEPEGGPDVGNIEVDKMYGYAALAGTTGGEGATDDNIHHFDNGYKFTAWLKAREKVKSKVPAIVWLSGEFTKEHGRDKSSPWFDIKDTKNLTIYGTNSFKMKNVGLFIVRSSNIIIRNLYIQMPKADNGADAISMQKSSKIWVDHCSIESINQIKDYEDGSVDVTHQTNGVTVSWNHFIKTQKTALVGHSNNEIADNQITATFHHNFFDQSNSRHPRVRFGTVHVYNNYFNKVETYGVGSAYGAKVLVENNYFDGVRLPTDICTFPAKPSGNNWVSNLQGSVAGYLYANEDNVYENKPSNASNPYPFINLEYKAYEGEKLEAPLTYDDFKPEYEYVTTKGEDVPAVVKGNAGVGKLSGYDTAPIKVDNGGITDPDPVDPDPTEPEEPGSSEGLGAGWLAKDVGTNQSTGSFKVDGEGKLTITSAGKFEGSNQSFYYVYREVEGDFVATLRIDNFNSIKQTNQSIGGLLFTPDLTAEGGDFLHAMSGEGGKTGEHNYSHRVLAGSAAKRGTLKSPTVLGGEVYVKLERKGNDYFASYSEDGGQTYGDVRTDTFTNLPSKIYIGIALNSGDNKETTSGTYSDFSINGEKISFVD